MIVRFIAVVALGSILTAPAQAFVGLQIFGGSRTSEVTPSNEYDGSTVDQSRELKGAEFGIGFLIKPYPLLPLAFGANMVSQNFTEERDEYGLKESLKGTLYSAAIRLWAPNTTMIEPFLHLNYSFHSQHTLAQDVEHGAAIFDLRGDDVSVELDGKMTGYHYGIGARFTPVPLFGIFAQADFANERFVPENGSLIVDGDGGLTSSINNGNDFKHDISSRSYILGFDLGM